VINFRQKKVACRLLKQNARLQFWYQITIKLFIEKYLVANQQAEAQLACPKLPRFGYARVQVLGEESERPLYCASSFLCLIAI
jgi:hypothetical protein